MMNYKERKKEKLKQIRNIELPKLDEKEISVENFVNIRENEIKAMELSLIRSRSTIGKQAFQLLPRMLRRRAASHNPKRIPFGLRKFAAVGVTAPKNVKTKKKRRRSYKRKPWFARTATGKRLVTHIWHAKRMKMETRWGFRLATKHIDKCRTRLLRAAFYGCTLHDASYYSILIYNSELMRQMVDPFDKRLFSACNAKKAIRIILYHPKKFPFECIGPVVVDLNCGKILAHAAISKELEKYFEKDETKFSLFQLRGPEFKIVVEKMMFNNDNCIVLELKNTKPALFGIDLLVSEAKCKEYWQKLVLSKIKVAALENVHLAHTESGAPCFPYDFIDTVAYNEFSEVLRGECQTVYDKKPPSKRVNYAKLGVNNPFMRQFKEGAWIVRGHYLLTFFNQHLHKDRSHLSQKLAEMLKLDIDTAETALKNANFQVEVFVKKGSIDDFSRIYTERKVLCGYITSAVYSLKRGMSYGIGCINFDAVAELKKKHSAKVYVQKSNSNYFHEASVKLLYIPY